MAAHSIYTYLLFCNAITLLLVSPCAGIGLDTVRNFLTREEDTIVFSLIERAKHPLNLPAYEEHACFGPDGRRRNDSFVELFVRESEEVQAKAGRYQSQEEIPFFHSRMPFTLAPPYNFTTDLYPAAASVNALSRRINYGRYVAEVKFRGHQQRYTALISSKDKDALMKLLTSEAQEDVVKRRVEKKAMVFGQDITLDEPTETGDMNSSQSSFKIAPSVVYKLYDEWVIPLTKNVEVDYLLHRLD
ncbi:hypothetical protein ACQ4PT_013452 [Festuca glaucescens]